MMTVQLLNPYKVNVTRAGLNAVKNAIMDAWSSTHHQMSEAGYDERIVHTAFGQFLVHNVRHTVFQLNESYPGIRVDLVPNKHGSAFHVKLEVNGLLVTISAVSDHQAIPRYAQFRDAYANQMFFYINQSDQFELSEYPEPRVTTPTYIQILHGPHEDNRQRLGFIRVALPNDFGRYNQAPMDFDEFLNSLSGEPEASDLEDVPDLDPLEIIETD